MGIDQFPAASSGISSVVRSVQRGVASSAGNVTISSVNVDKSQVTSFSTGAAGSAAVNGSMRSRLQNNNAPSLSDQAEGHYTQGGFGRYTFAHYSIFGASQVLSGGTSTLTAASHGAYLSNSTTLAVTGPCRYEVVEYV
jgi:hypothetical protein